MVKLKGTTEAVYGLDHKEFGNIDSDTVVWIAWALRATNWSYRLIAEKYAPRDGYRITQQTVRTVANGLLTEKQRRARTKRARKLSAAMNYEERILGEDYDVKQHHQKKTKEEVLYEYGMVDDSPTDHYPDPPNLKKEGRLTCPVNCSTEDHFDSSICLQHSDIGLTDEENQRRALTEELPY